MNGRPGAMDQARAEDGNREAAVVMHFLARKAHGNSVKMNDKSGMVPTCYPSAGDLRRGELMHLKVQGGQRCCSLDTPILHPMADP